MSGNNRDGFVLQDRDRHLLRELSPLRVVDREQAKVVAGFHSTSRVNSRLLKLTEAGLLRRSFIGSERGGMQAIYELTPKGAKVVDVPYRHLRRKENEILVADFFVAHQLAVNEVYCLLKYAPIPIPDAACRRWESFHEPIASGTSLIPDGYVEVVRPERTLAAFLEVDLANEGRKVWQGKVERYLAYAASGNFQLRFHSPQFRVLVIANSESRMHSLRAFTATITEKVFWFSSFESIRRDGFWSPVWFRPKSDQRQSLF